MRFEPTVLQFFEIRLYKVLYRGQHAFFERLGLREFDVSSQFRGDELRQIRVQFGIDGCHHAFADQNPLNLGCRDTRGFGELTDRAR